MGVAAQEKAAKSFTNLIRIHWMYECQQLSLEFFLMREPHLSGH